MTENQASQIYQQVCEHVRQTALLRSTHALLEWDQQTQLPAAAHEYRSEQSAFLAGLIHQRATSPELGDWLGQLAESELVQDATSDQAVTIARLKYEYDRSTRLPESLVQALAKSTSRGQNLWVAARQNNDFASFAPQLDEICRLKREQADALEYSGERYDALMENYERGAITSDVATVLQGLCDELVPLVASVKDSSNAPDTSILKRSFPVDRQQQLGRQASAAIGFDYQRGRLDITHHPFCTEIGPDDCRITTRYDEHFFSGSFFGTLHEAGHGIYEQGLRSDQYGLPLGQYCSLGIHESQSRLWENLVGRSEAFWQHFYPSTQQLFSESLGDVSRSDFYRAINAVEPSLIRVEADEATYNLHIIIRFELERDLMNDNLAIDDLPGAWNEKYRRYLGIDVPNDAQGVLQDVHWSAGLFGYFPTYTLGNLYAAQFFHAAAEELGDLNQSFARGEFDSLKRWLNQHVHQPGSRWTGPELGTHVTGEPLTHLRLMDYLKSKLESVYRQPNG